MALDGVNGINQKNIEKIEITNGQKQSQLNHILEFADDGNLGLSDKEPSDAKVRTEIFKDEIMSKLNTSGTDKSQKKIQYYLDKLVEVIQELNGVQKNNLKPNGTKKQNEVYKGRIQERLCQMRDYVEFVGSSLSVVQDSKTGLYKLCIDNKLYDIPERKVEIATVETEDGVELLPEIVD